MPSNEKVLSLASISGVTSPYAGGRGNGPAILASSRTARKKVE